MSEGQRAPAGEGVPVWDETLPDEDAAALDPGVPADLPTAPDVLVIGGGQVGLAIAATCVRMGVGSVLLLERGRLANGPSGRNGGFLLVDVARSWPEVWRTLSARAFELHRELDADWGHGLRLMDLWTPDQMLLSSQGHVHPLRLAAAYARHAGTVATDVHAADVELRGGRIVRVHTSHGDIDPGAVVFATGCCPAEARVDQTYLKGHVIATEPARFALDRMVVDGEVGVVQLEDGRLVCGGSKDFDDTTTPVVEATVARLRAAMSALVPEADGLDISHAWSCFRPRVADDFPVIDLLPGTTNAYIVAGLFSTGVLMAPVVGELLANWIGGERFEGYDMFALGRRALQAAQGPVPTADLRPRA